MSDSEHEASSSANTRGASAVQPVSSQTLELALIVQRKVHFLVEAIHRVTQALADFEQLDVIQEGDANHEFLAQFNQILGALAMVGANLGVKFQTLTLVEGLVPPAVNRKVLDSGVSNGRGASKNSRSARIKKIKETRKRSMSTSEGEGASDSGSALPLYKMNRKTRNLQELVQEWYHGINGGPSVKALEAKYGSKWRTKNDAERVFLGRRKVIIKRIEDLENKYKGHKTRDQIVNELEQERISLGKSIDGLGRFYRTNKI
ncbi:hypothetical protein D0Z00_002654 [Geotrichum galactomycetum]|uniref:Uncharacterized protein n=1 Tax=Geotrichum galactomycetum TaxID=27317 RepID=A0ACB6V3I6_9ASCO|nr:hypothetical protein D0Z00_002654 [Geotrichum candidum]